MPDPVPVSDIASLHWQPRLNAEGEIVEGLDDIAQCIGTILTTPLRSDPHRPAFGCDLLPWLDRPADAAIPHLIRAASEAIARWEPRVQVTRILAAIDGAHVTLTVLWTAVGLDAGQATEVAL